jgi:hypothetical protein
MPMMGPMIARLLAVLIAFAAPAAASAQTHGQNATLVVELFTSQGCAQCPRANRLLGMFAREDGVLALTFPVGIWDYLGWRDTFARPEFTERQRLYAQTLRGRGRFTPQLVIDGDRQISASDWDAARAMIEEVQAPASAEAPPHLSITRLRSGRVRVTAGAAPRDMPTDLWLVAYEAGPLTVSIMSGLNRDRSVSHYNLVRSIEAIEGWTGAAAWFERSRCAPRCAVLMQHRGGGPILAAAFVER